MSFRDPRRRKPIRDKVPLDEIRDNVKNDAVLTSARSKSKYKQSNSGDEELLESESTKNLYQTFTISSSLPNQLIRNSGTNMNRTNGQKRNQSPETYNRQSYNSNTDSDISDDEEDGEISIRNRSHEVNRPNNSTHRINLSDVSDTETFLINGIFDLQKNAYRTTTQHKTENNHKQYCFTNDANKSRSSSTTKLNKSTSESKNGIYILLALIIGCLFIYFMINRTNSVDIGVQTEAIDVESNSESQVLNDVLITFKNMKSKYKNQNRDLWLDAYSSIASLINQETKKPSIIVLLGNKSDPLECLARLIGNVSSKALRSDRLVLTPKEFEADMGSVIQTMRSHLKDNKAIIVSDLLNVNVEALKAFHNLCDRINPLVEEAIYIITVIADDYDDNTNPLKYIENQLRKKLSGKMKEDAIQPLITRLTDGPILTVNPEPTVTDCSL